MGVPDKAGGTLAFKAVQTYSNGEVVRWIGPPDADEPAPQVKLTSAPAEEGAAEPAAAEQAPPPAEADDGGSDTLAIIALIVGIAGLAAGLFALFRATRSQPGGSARDLIHDGSDHPGGGQVGRVNAAAAKPLGGPVTRSFIDE